MSIIYHWNQNQMFCHHSNLDIAYHVSMGIYKLLNLTSMPQNDYTLMPNCSMSICTNEMKVLRGD